MMSANKKIESAPHSGQNSKRPSLSSRNAETKFNRHKKYKEMLPAEKDAFLLQRRTRELDSRRRLFQQNNPLIIREPSVAKKAATTSEPNAVADPSTKGKDLVHPLSVFETGSTSGAYIDPCDLASTNVSNRGLS